MDPGRAHIFGTGLIGASVGLGLRRLGWEVGGWDPDSSALVGAKNRGALTLALDGPDPGGADLVVLAAPPSAVMTQLGMLETDALVTDVAGVKGPVVEAADHLSRFVGGHPMAGGETSGASMASASLFQGATWVVTTDGADNSEIQSVTGLAAALGANPVTMTAGEHDAAVARISHLPHVLAVVLMNMNRSEVEAIAGGGFRDLTRVAAGDTNLWLDILTSNREALNAVIADLRTRLDRWTSGERDDLHSLLENARKRRLDLGEHNTQIRVVLLDKPGEIARVGHALEKSKVDVRDLQLRHGEHGGGGVLTISVRRDGRDPLVKALTDEGFEIQSG